MTISKFDESKIFCQISKIKLSMMIPAMHVLGKSIESGSRLTYPQGHFLVLTVAINYPSNASTYM